MEWRIPLSDIDFGEEEKNAVTDVLQSKWLTMGSVTQEFEQAFADYVGAKYAIAVTNATAALHLACVVAGLGPGDEAIVPSLTFVATANAVRYTGADSCFCGYCWRTGSEHLVPVPLNKPLPNEPARSWSCTMAAMPAICRALWNWRANMV